MLLIYGFLLLSMRNSANSLSHQYLNEEFEIKNEVSWPEITLIYECPEQCHCSSSEHADCSEANLRTVPQNISRNTLHLMLNRNKLQSLSSECFDECPLIRTLNLQNNMLSDEGLSPSTFAPLHNLHHLILSDNLLRFVPEGLPNTLITLQLARNAIKQIDPPTLAWKDQLRHLYLHNNHLTKDGMKPQIFDGLTHLEEVTLSNNKFSDFPPVPSSAEVVYLHNNSIVSIPEGSFRGKQNIRVLFLQKNNISNDGLNRKSFLGLRKIEYLDLSENSLTRIPAYLPTKLMRLHLEKNKISSLTAGAMKRLRYQKHLLIQRFNSSFQPSSSQEMKYLANQDDILKVEYLILHHNDIGPHSIELGAFLPLRRLHTLHIFDNKLETIPPKLPKRLKSLVLLQNKIRTISANAFASTKGLNHLDLRYNQLTNRRIERGALKRLKNLTSIDFSGNVMRAVPMLPRNVTTLLLTSNRVSRIPPRSLSRIPWLRHLSLGNNNLQNKGIPLDVFRQSNDIKVLDLSGNLLVSIPKYLPANLEYVYLQNNFIEKIPRNAFLYSLKLKVIYLQGNQLLPETVSKSAFAPLRILQRIDVTWRRRRPGEILYDEISTPRRRRAASWSLQELCDKGWLYDKCARTIIKSCLTGKIMVFPRFEGLA